MKFHNLGDTRVRGHQHCCAYAFENLCYGGDCFKKNKIYSIQGLFCNFTTSLGTKMQYFIIEKNIILEGKIWNQI